MYARPKAHGKHKGDARGYLIIGGCAVMVAGAVGALAVLKPAAIDPSSGCQKGKRSPVQHIAIVDLSDPLSAANQGLLIEALVNLAGSIGVGDRLTIVPFDGRPDIRATAILDRCRPAHSSETSALTTTAKKVDREFERKFVAPLSHALTSLGAQGKASSETHLVAFLGNIGSSAGYRSQADRVAIRLFSDMAENTSRGSFVAKGKQKPFDTGTFTAHFKALTAGRLAGVRVDVHAIQHPSINVATAKRLRDSWSAAFTASGVVEFSWRAL